MNTKILYILLVVMIGVTGVIGYFVYDAYQDYTGNDTGSNNNIDEVKTVQAETENEDLSNNETIEIDKELNDLIKKIKGNITLADSNDDIEKMMEIVGWAEGIDESIDYELKVALTFAKLRISTVESVWVQKNPSYVRTTTEEDGYDSKLARLVHPSYNGILSDRIKQILSFRYTREKWVAEYNEYNNIAMKELSIGMTQQEVIDLTTWGRPTKINKTENAYGVSEQWVYPNYQYLYFDDGILTSISTND